MKNIRFKSDSWEQYLYWQTQDKKTLKKINRLLDDISRNGHNGIGHPEPLKEDLSGWYSREIDEKNRLVYKIENNDIIILQCKNHYFDK